MEYSCKTGPISKLNIKTSCIYLNKNNTFFLSQTVNNGSGNASCYGPPKRGLPATEQTLSRWIVDAIYTANESSQLPSPMGVKAHSTRSLQGLPRRCPNTGHLQRCGMVYAPDLCQVLWTGHAGHSRPFCPLALDVLHRNTHWAGTGKSGSMDILFPWRSRTQLKFLKRNVLGYVCNPSSLREWDTASRYHTGIPASACFISEADAGFTARAFIPAGHYVTSPIHWTDLTCIQSRLRWRRSPSTLRHSVSFPRETRVTYRCLRCFLPLQCYFFIPCFL